MRVADGLGATWAEALVSARGMHAGFTIVKGLNECRALADKMVATSDYAKPSPPSAVQAILRMKPAEENR